MNRSAASFALIAFFLWILPLGSFIRPADEESACGGKRAMHMCGMKTAGTSVKTGEKPAREGIAFSNPSAPEKGPGASAASSDIAFSEARRVETILSSRFSARETLPPLQVIRYTPSPVPKT